MIKKVICIDIWSSNYKKLAEWYITYLNLVPVQELNLPDDTGIVFDIGGTLLYIGQHSEVKGKSKDSNRIMVEFEIDSIFDVCKNLESRGVEFVRKPEKASTNDMYVATIYDLDKNIIQLVQPI